MLKKLFCLVVAAVLLAPAPVFAQNNVQRYVNETLKTDPLWKNAAVAILAVDGRGRTVAQWNPDLPLLSASTMKTVTTGAALTALGTDFRFETKIAVAGRVDEDGILHGDLYIIGGGDPTLGSKSGLAEDITAVFAKWTAAVKAAGITAVDGNIKGDAGIFGGDVVQENWCWIDLGADYGSGPGGLSFCENLSFYRVEPGAEEGAPLAITPVEAVYSEMNVASQAVTGAPKTGNKVNYFASDLSPVGRFTGTYAIDRKTDTIAVSNKFPALTCAEAFCRYLEGEGIPAAGVALGAAPDSAALLVTSYSPSLLSICRETNTKSNNFFAETIFLTMGRLLTDDVSYTTTPPAVERYIADMGCNTTGLRQDDGSGLSRMNYVTPRFFCNFYRIMQKSDIFAQYLSTFPTPGGDGTLRYVLAKEPESLRSRIHCKSGSMTAVKCYAGYVETAGGEQLCFAIMVNNYDCPTREMQPKIEGFLKQLALYERQ
ncbi:MAG: D-alanyl-D-alanine carboxypeptidase/D-alanyl-D-alanine-endopeptidase [Bacteroidales bacterium]|nr:D-alanyl-D-alanine carboxypeptidase/D-alanyl-D-alanine-endopeptidase [Bacteroidales bacterium]